MPTGLKPVQANDDIDSVELKNSNGASIRILDLGARIAELNIPCGDRGIINTVLGYPHLPSYRKDSVFHGAVTGRFSNRIRNGRFTLEGQTYQLDLNEGRHHLHGGRDGFDRRRWSIEKVDGRSAQLSLFSPAGDQGYPGNLDVCVRYTLDDDNCLEIEYQAVSDSDTVVNLSSHSYFNLAGCGDIRQHHLRIAADAYTPVDRELIPTGEVLAVDGTALDLREFTPVDRILDCEEPIVEFLGGLDYNWARGRDGELLLTAELYCPDTALLLQLSSTLPGLQCYTGNNLGAGGVHGCHEGICLEPQYYPDSPNQPGFPTAILRAGETRRHTIRYQFKQLENNGDLFNE